MKLSRYILQTDFNAPKMGSGQDVRKNFKMGEEVVGYIYVEEDSPLALPPQVIVDNSYVIPKTKLKKIGDVADQSVAQESESPVESNSVVTTVEETVENEFDKVKGTSVVHDAIAKSKNSVSGMVYGGGAGLIISALFKKSLLGGIIIGSIIGGFIGNKISTDFSKINQDPKQ